MKNNYILATIGSLISIVMLGMFALVTSSVITTILSGIGCVSSMFLFTDYLQTKWNLNKTSIDLEEALHKLDNAKEEQNNKD